MVFKKILADDETRQAAKDLLAYVFAQDDIRDLVAEFFKNVIKMDIVVKQATELGMIKESIGDAAYMVIYHLHNRKCLLGSTVALLRILVAL